MAELTFDTTVSIDSIVSYTGDDWNRSGQSYTVDFISGGSSILSYTVGGELNNDDATGLEVQVTIVDDGGGALATNVDSLRFEFFDVGDPSNGESVYREIDVNGNSSDVIPEPASIAIWLLGLLGLAWYGRRRRR